MGADPTIVKSLQVFPKEFSGGFFRSLDKSFAVIFGVCTAVIFSVVYILSNRPVSLDATDNQVAKIQERYARLVLDVKKPEPPPKEEVTKRKREKPKSDKEEPKKKVKHKKESFADRMNRKKRTQSDRVARRRKLDKHISSVGIFAAITSSSNDVSGDAVQDLISTGEVTKNLSKLAISGKTFTKRRVETLKRRRKEDRTSGGSIARSKLKSAKSDAITRRGDVALSDKPQEIKGDAKQDSKRTYEAIGRVINSKRARLVYVFEKYLKKEPNLSGKLIIKFTILPNGSIVNVTVVSSTINNSDFQKTVCRYVRRWKFPVIPDEQGEVTVTYPFVFSGVQG